MNFSNIIENRMQNQFGVGDFARFREYQYFVESHFEKQEIEYLKSFDDDLLKYYSRVKEQHDEDYYKFLLGQELKKKKIYLLTFRKVLDKHL